MEALNKSRGGRSDGAFGYAAARWLCEYGVLLRKDYSKKTGNPEHSLKTYSGIRSKDWGDFGCGGKEDKGTLDKITKSYPIENVVQITQVSPEAVPHLASKLKVDPGATLFDPCAGKAQAVVELAAALQISLSKVYGAEMDERALGTLSNGMQISVVGAKVIPFTATSAKELYPRRDYRFLSCRNFQFAAHRFGFVPTSPIDPQSISRAIGRSACR